MPKNIVIFSDGTGQRAGINFDEKRTNIYKLYRGTRCGPDSEIDPSEQVTFYDPGIGTAFPREGLPWPYPSTIYNWICQATGIGLTKNLIDCYAAIIRTWNEGDRILLFGFSRGAYTVRLLGGVLALCGVPTTDRNGKELRRDEKTSRRIAKRAILRVYQHTSSRNLQGIHNTQKKQRLWKLLDQRSLLAEEFRREFGSADVSYQPERNENAGDYPEHMKEKGVFPDRGQSNAVPHFIGVFDTVASVSSPVALGIMFSAIAALLVFLVSMFPIPLYMRVLLWIVVVLGLVVLFARNWGFVLKAPGRIGQYSFWETLTFTGNMRFGDTTLSSRVPYARHAISIDEDRWYFQSVPWSRFGEVKFRKDDGLQCFEQVWFSGVHADIGGGYPENESRLSDISFDWMLAAAETEQVGLFTDRRILRRFPDSAGMQHNERLKFPWYFLGRKPRTVSSESELHNSVHARLKEGAVNQSGEYTPYRPKNLSEHPAMDG